MEIQELLLQHIVKRTAGCGIDKSLNLKRYYDEKKLDCTKTPL